MRRWQLLNRLLRLRDPLPWDRCVPVVEELETRENPAPFVAEPDIGTPQTPEGNALTFSGGSAFSASDANNSSQTYAATLTSTNGPVTVDEATAVAAFSLTVANNGTAAVTITGQLDVINA